MSKLLLWVCVGVCGAIAGALPMLWDSTDFIVQAVLSTVGGLFGIWVWYRFIRFA